MKLRLISGILLTLLFATNMFAQSSDEDNDPTAKEVKVKLSFGKEYKNERSNTQIYYLLKDGEGDIYAIKMASGGYFSKSKRYIEKYTSKMVQIFEKELTVDNTEGNDLSFIAAKTVNGIPYIFASYLNKTTQMDYFFSLKIEKNGAVGKPVKIAGVHADDKDGANFGIKFSKDSSKVLIISETSKLEGKNLLSNHFEFSVSDNQFKEIWKGQTTIPSPHTVRMKDGVEFNSLMDNFKVDNSGRVSTLDLIQRDQDKKDKNAANYFYKLYCYENGSKEVKKFTIDLDSRSISNLNLLVTSIPDEKIGIGTYSDSKKGINGTFYFKINAKTGVVSNKSINPFSQNMYGFMKVDDKDQKKGEGIPSLHLQGHWMTENNNVLFSLDQQYSIWHTNNVGGRVSSYYTYHSETMFNVKYDGNGKIIYQNYTPKNVWSRDQPFGLYHILAPRGESNALIFNDSKKNTEKKLENYSKMSKANPGSSRCVARLVTTDEQGKRKASTLFSNKEEDFVLQPDMALNYAPGVIFTTAVDGKKFKFVKIEY